MSNDVGIILSRLKVLEQKVDELLERSPSVPTIQSQNEACEVLLARLIRDGHIKNYRRDGCDFIVNDTYTYIGEE